MTVKVYYDDDEQFLRVNGELRPFHTAADIRNLMQLAYEAGEKKEGYIFSGEFSKPEDA